MKVRKVRPKRLKRILAYQAFLIPAVIIYLVFFIYPMIISITYSFTSMHFARLEWGFVGFENYIRLFTEAEVSTAITNTIYFAFFSTVFVNILALFIAICFDHKFRGANLLRMFIFAPAVIGGLIVGYAWTFVLSSSQHGLANVFLAIINVGPISWFGDVRFAMNSIIFVYIWQWTGWCMVIYQANLQTIPEEYYEAAAIDGASVIQRVFRITLPNMVTSVTINSVLFMIGGLRVYDIIIATTRGGPGYATETFTTVLVRTIFGMNQFGYGSAIAVVLFLVILAVTLVQLVILNIWEKKVT